MGNATGSHPKSHFGGEIEMIMSDILTPDDQRLSPMWEFRPLRDDDSYWEFPKYLDDGSPQFFIVTLTFEQSSTSQVADMTRSAAYRVFFLADWASDEISEETREPRPECPVHAHGVLIAEIDNELAIWKCPRDESIRCDIGSYWTWRANQSV
jgi:hypothetical protein